MPCYLRIAEKLKRKQRVNLALPNSWEFTEWFERKLLEEYHVNNHRLLKSAVEQAYKENPYEVSVRWGSFISEWIQHEKEEKERQLENRRLKKRQIRRPQSV